MSGCTPDEVIHVGDSLSSDIEGAQRLGIQAIWLNRLNKQLPDHYKPDYICSNLIEVKEVIISSKSLS
ncbi:HAD family hydrolase [Paenibacillus sp. Marseille-Q4541]|uniref:HAD family hydrolase n=1 Tax=Paenibacillus sp. Marseille-Q4541 TaxID=2831522 RepID=UPI001BAE1BC5